MDCTRVTEWIYVITGFTQTRATRSRMVELWKELYDEYASPSTLVELRQWRWNWKAEAEHVFRLAPDDQNASIPRVKICAYSWGGGWGFTRFAQALGHRGLPVTSAVLSDPVYRHPYILGHWRTIMHRPNWPFLDWWPIVVPDNVDEVYSFYQRKNWPCGHMLQAAGRQTTIHHPVKLQAVHSAMDDQPEFLARCRQVAAQRLRIHPDTRL